MPLWPAHRTALCRAAVAAAAGVAATACGAAQPGPAAALPTATASAGRTATPAASAAPSAASYSGPVAPLTGLPAASAAAAGSPAVALAVAGAGPRGLSQADVVFEEISHPVRYIAVFQSRLPPAVGPITSTLPTDGMTLSVLHPLTGYSGGTPSFIQVLDSTKIIDAGYPAHAPLYHSGPAGLTAAPGPDDTGRPGFRATGAVSLPQGWPGCRRRTGEPRCMAPGHRHGAHPRRAHPGVDLRSPP